MAPSARVSSGVCCCEVDQCLDLLYDLDEWKGRLSYVILHGTLPLVTYEIFAIYLIALSKFA